MEGRGLVRTNSTHVRLAAVAVIGAMALAGCSSTGGKKATEEQNAKGGHANTPRFTAALITHSAPGDTFWDMVRKGAQAAADKDNIKLEYYSDPDAAKQASLVQAAVDKKVGGIAVTLAKPNALRKAVKNATAAGIPVDGLNSGTDQMGPMGLIGFFGQDELVAGQAAGDRLKKAGAKQPICIIHEQGNVGLNDRCKGVKEKVPSTKVVYVNGADLPSVRSTITATLQENKKIDWIVGLQGDVSLNAVKAVKSTGSKAKVGTFDTNPGIVKAIQDGTVQFAVDQQPWLQGYLAIDALWFYRNNGDTVGGGKPTLTGPAFVDKSNVDKIADYAKKGTR